MLPQYWIERISVMEKEKMLVTQGLNELKLLDSRIEKETQKGNFITVAKTNESKVNPNLTKEDFKQNAISTYQSIIDLIERRNSIKRAIVESNAKTIVTVAGIEMTVAAAIEMKTTIEYEYSLLTVLRNQYERAKSTMNMQNVNMEAKIDEYIKIMVGKDNTKVKQEDIDAMTKPIREANEYSMVDPLNIEEKIKMLSDKVERFKSEVDSVLQISNCVTWIEI